MRQVWYPAAQIAVPRPVRRERHRPQLGLGRIPVGVMDLLSVWFQLRFGREPLLFCVSGTLLFRLGFIVGLAALVIPFGFGVGFRPLLNLIEVLVISDIALSGFALSVSWPLASARKCASSTARYRP